MPEATPEAPKVPEELPAQSDAKDQPGSVVELPAKPEPVQSEQVEPRKAAGCFVSWLMLGKMMLYIDAIYLILY